MTTRLEKMEKWLRNQPVISIIILVGGATIAISEFVRHGSDLLSDLGIKEEKALHLAQDSAKGELSQKLTELAWRRMFWSRNYAQKVHLKRPMSEQDYSWNKHLDTVADWSS